MATHEFHGPHIFNSAASTFRVFPLLVSCLDQSGESGERLGDVVDWFELDVIRKIGFVRKEW